MVQVITGGKYVSTPHRVIHNNTSNRISVPFFYEPSFDAEIYEVLGADGGRKTKSTGPSLLYGDHLVRKVDQNFDI